MLIVVDGDSCALSAGWPALFATTYEVDVTCLSTHKALSKDVIARLNKAIELKPYGYILHLTQWWCNDEDYLPFVENLAYIVKVLHRNHIRVCLITPPPSMRETIWVSEAIRGIALEYNTALVDLHTLMKDCDASYFMPETISCHLSGKGEALVVKCFNTETKFYRGFL